MTIAEFPDRLKALLEAGETVYIYITLTLYNQCEFEVDDIQKNFNYLYPGKLKFIVSEKVESGLIMTTVPRLDLSPHGHEF
jgi:hypothetical protein